MDNYEGPNASIAGKIVDLEGNMIQTEQGGGNLKIKMEELSWPGGDTTIAIIPFYLNVKQDGSFNNSKVFAGEYKITPIEGAFYPYNVGGDTVNISGYSNELEFTVIPYLKIEWVTAPYLTTDNFIEAEIKFTRNADAVLPKPDLFRAQFFISTNKYCGNNNNDGQMSPPLLTVTNAQEGTTIKFRTARAVKYTGTTYFVRVGVNCNDAYKKYNYTDIKPVVVPAVVVK